MQRDFLSFYGVRLGNAKIAVNEGFIMRMLIVMSGGQTRLFQRACFFPSHPVRFGKTFPFVSMTESDVSHVRNIVFNHYRSFIAYCCSLHKCFWKHCLMKAPYLGNFSYIKNRTRRWDGGIMSESETDWQYCSGMITTRFFQIFLWVCRSEDVYFRNCRLPNFNGNLSTSKWDPLTRPRSLPDGYL